MSDLTVTNWFGDLVSHPRIIVDANSVDDIIKTLKDPGRYPSPVRAVGSNHSTAPCGVADGGTLIRMKMNRILNIGADTLTVEAGAIHDRHGGGALEAQPAVLREHGNRQPLGRKRSLCRDKGFLFSRRIRSGGVVCHRRQNGASIRGPAGSYRTAAGPDAEGEVQLRHLRHRL